MIQPDMLLLLLLHPDFIGMPSLSDVDLTTFSRVAVDTSCFQAKFIFDGPKQTVNLPRW
jgi:hypothetical protein